MVLDAAIDRVASATSGAFEIIWKSNPRWPATGTKLSAGRIAVLDSSFNPPHLAHKAMAMTSFPAPLKLTRDDNFTKSPATPPRDYAARLLIFSTKNVEKKPAKGDASTQQRLEMTLLLGKTIAEEDLSTPVAVGITNEATFVRKSALIRDYLEKTHEQPSALAFLIGTDTLTRFFDAKFYPPGQMDSALAGFFLPPPKGDGSVVVFAQRGGTEGDRNLERGVMGQDNAKIWVESGGVRMATGIDHSLVDVSSTSVRRSAGERARLEELLPAEVVEYIIQEGLYGFSGETA